jgi:hypothetical protein
MSTPRQEGRSMGGMGRGRGRGRGIEGRGRGREGRGRGIEGRRSRGGVRAIPSRRTSTLPGCLRRFRSMPTVPSSMRCSEGETRGKRERGGRDAR